MAYGIEISKANGTKNVSQTTIGGRVFVQLINLSPAAAGTVVPYIYDYITSHTYLKLYIINPGAYAVATSTVSGKAKITLTAQYAPTYTESTVIAVFTTQVSEPDYGVAMINDSNERTTSSIYPVPEFLGRFVPSNTPATTTHIIGTGTTKYSHTVALTAGTGRNRIALWTIPESTTCWIKGTSFIDSGPSQYLEIEIYGPTSSAYSVPEAYVYAIDGYSPSADTYGLRLYNSSSQLIFDAGLNHMQIKAYDNITFSTIESSITSNILTGTIPAILLPTYMLETMAQTVTSQGATLDSSNGITNEGLFRRIGTTLYTKIILTGKPTEDTIVNYTLETGSLSNTIFGVDAQALGAGTTQVLNGSIINTTTAGGNLCSYYPINGQTNCTTTGTYTSSYSGGTGNAVTCVWSLVGATGFSISGSTTSASVTIVNSGSGTTTYTGTLQCVFTQTGSTAVTASYSLSDTHTSIVTALSGTLATTLQTSTCSYNQATASNCTTQETVTITPHDGNGSAITYAWSVSGDNAASFSLSSATGTSTIVSLLGAGITTGTTYTTTLYCTMTQSGANTIVSKTVTHTHTGTVTAFTGTVSLNSATTTCNYISPATSCNTTESYTAYGNNGNGTAITYVWSLVDGNAASFSLSSTTTQTISVYSNAAGTATYVTTLRCVISQAGVNSTVDTAISHVHTAYAALGGTIAQSNATTACTYVGPTTSCNTQETWTATPSGGNSNAITYAWSVAGGNAASFSLSSTTASSTTISLAATGISTGQTYTTTLQCIISQSGAVDVTRTQAISHVHTGYATLTASLVQSAATTGCTYNQAIASSCNTQETWTVSTGGGDGNPITYAWSLSGGNAASFGLSSTTGTSTTISLAGPGLSTGTTYATTLECVITQSGSTTVTLTQAISHTHTGSYSTVQASFTTNSATTTCNYISPATSCNTTESITVNIVSGGDGSAITYVWSVTGGNAASFSLSSTTTQTISVYSNATGIQTGSTYTTTLQCAIWQSGAVRNTITKTITHVHTGYSAFDATLAPSAATTTCNYTAPTSNCTTQETWTTTPSGGTGNAITYVWSVSGGNAASFTLSSTTAAATTISLTGTGLSTGTTYATTLQCVITQSGSTTVTKTQAISQVHTGYPALSASIARTGSPTLSCTYTTPINTSCTTQETWTATPSGGNANAITYAWSVTGGNAASFSLSSTTASSTSISLTGNGLTTGTTYTTTLQCITSQSGATSVTSTTSISQTHTQITGSTLLTPLGFNAKLYTNSRPDDGSSYISLLIYTDGTWEIYGDGSLSNTPITGDWCDTKTSSTKNTYYVRFTRTAGQTDDASPYTLNVPTSWQLLNLTCLCTNAAWLGETGSKTNSATFTVEFSYNGSTVATSNTVSLNAYTTYSTGDIA